MGRQINPGDRTSLSLVIHVSEDLGLHDFLCSGSVFMTS